MRKVYCTGLVACLLLVAGQWMAPPAQAQRPPATAYVVADATTGYVLDALNANRKLQVGSLTKIATAMVTIDWLDLTRREASELAVVPYGALTFPSANPMNLQPGDRMSVRDLLYAALLQSDNIAAQTLAEHVGRTLPGEGSPADRFVAQMNALARRLGMKRTLFLNPHGLDGIERKLPYSTAADMGRLARYAMGSSAFRFYVAQKERQVTIHTAGGTPTVYLLKNTNELLGIDGIDGIKTGRTIRAGDCVIVSAERPPETSQKGDVHFITVRRLIVVVLGARQRFPVARGLLAEGWRLYDEWAARGRPTKGGMLLVEPPARR